ncbi:MAG: hypothetical protein CMF31_07920 [Kordiimonas sp.]|nr:hypothetical protein [Kordiimonas sp.]|tara:strand:- start:621 stop:1196 length:576 start_codon:yes stop_codon:yes gene_type:complete
MSEVVWAILLGGAFGFALNRVGATNPEYIINMVRLKDLHLMKVIVFAVGLSSAMLFVALALGWVDVGNLSVKTSYAGVMIGGAIMGVGFAIAGYCPGTGISAAATGRLDAGVFVIGGLLGAFVYMLSYETVKDLGWLNEIFGGKATIAATSHEKYVALIDVLPGPVTAIIIAVVLMTVAAVLPRHIGGKNN